MSETGRMSMSDICARGVRFIQQLELFRTSESGETRATNEFTKETTPLAHNCRMRHPDASRFGLRVRKRHDDLGRMAVGRAPGIVGSRACSSVRAFKKLGGGILSSRFSLDHN